MAPWPSLRGRDRAAPHGPFRLPAMARKQVRPQVGEPDICAQHVIEPSADVVAGGPAPLNDLVVTSAPAEIAGPATPARFLPIDVAVREPRPLPIAVDAPADVPHGTGVVLDEAMTRKQP